MGKFKELVMEGDLCEEEGLGQGENVVRHIKEEGFLDFSWGDTRGLRKVILDIYKNLRSFQTMPLDDYGYPPYEGDPELVELIRKLTQFLTTDEYKFIAIASGCTHAANASFYALRDSNTSVIATRSMYYPRYPSMIHQANLEHTFWDINSMAYGPNDIAVVESPSNPKGDTLYASINTGKLIWDAAYYTPTYGVVPGLRKVSEAKIFCGSMSKLSGINGIRIGWTATNDKLYHEKIVSYIESSICGVSYPSQYLAKEILKDEESLHRFFKHSNLLISLNKEEVLKLKDIFGSSDISPFGMFAFFEADDAMLRLFEKAKVKFTDGKECGSKVPSVRINLANTNEQTVEMVKRIKKADKKRGI